MGDVTWMSSQWCRAVKGIVVAELSGIEIVEDLADSSAVIAESVCAAIHELPWFYRQPLKMLAHITGVVSIVFTMANLDSTGDSSRHRLLTVLGFLPGFGLFRKYVRALALLALFDSRGVKHPLAIYARSE